jgi:RNA polymerase sigma factor (TIGR02999 family)
MAVKRDVCATTCQRLHRTDCAAQAAEVSLTQVIQVSQRRAFRRRHPHAAMLPYDTGTDPPQTDTLLPLVYEELKRLAHHNLRVAGARAALCTTELVHEAFLKLACDRHGSWEGRAHFFGSASRAMRQVLVDFARRRRSAKRGGYLQFISLHDVHAALEIEIDDILALETALVRLEAVNPRLCQVVELRFFGGLDVSAVAELLGVTTRTVERDWLKARLFLLRELEAASPSSRAEDLGR